MGFKAKNTIPEAGYLRAKILLVNADNFFKSSSLKLQTDTNADVVLGIFHDCRRLKDDLDNIKAIPGIGQYAKDQELDQSYDVVSAFNTVIATISAVMSNIRSTFPVDGNGYLLEKKFNAQGTYDFRQFTATQTATLRALLDTASSEIE